jgi:hypothetical protein
MARCRSMRGDRADCHTASQALSRLATDSQASWLSNQRRSQAVISEPRWIASQRSSNDFGNRLVLSGDPSNPYSS